LNTIVVAVITGAFGILSGVLASYLTFRNNVRLSNLEFRNDLKAEYDKDLRNERIEAYQGLWHLFQYLGRYDLPEALTAELLKKLSEEMRDWYFGGGGLYLSEQSRTTYFKLKEDIKNILDNTEEDRWDALLNPEDRKLVLEQGHLLRDSLTHDVGTRKSSALAD
jgi:hypothetical protein